MVWVIFYVMFYLCIFLTASYRKKKKKKIMYFVFEQWYVEVQKCFSPQIFIPNYHTKYYTLINNYESEM